MRFEHGLLIASVALGHLSGCNRQRTSEVVCRALEQEKIAEGCKEGAHPLFAVPRHGSQWTFAVAGTKETFDPILGKGPKPSGVIIEFASARDRDVAVDYLNGMNSALPVLPFVHKLAKPWMLVLLPKHDESLRTQSTLERLYGYSD